MCCVNTCTCACISNIYRSYSCPKLNWDIQYNVHVHVHVHVYLNLVIGFHAVLVADVWLYGSSLMMIVG